VLREKPAESVSPLYERVRPERWNVTAASSGSPKAGERLRLAAAASTRPR